MTTIIADFHPLNKTKRKRADNQHHTNTYPYLLKSIVNSKKYIKYDLHETFPIIYIQIINYYWVLKRLQHAADRVPIVVD